MSKMNTWLQIYISVILLLHPASIVIAVDTKLATEKHEYKTVIQLLNSLHQKSGSPEAGDWLYEHNEPGQTFDDYINSNPVRPDGRRKVIYIKPLGVFSEEEKEIIRITGDYLSCFYGLETIVLKPSRIDSLPPVCKRVHPSWGVKQVLTDCILHGMLKRNMPPDAVASIAITNIDLWPGDGWNFVFGQASLDERVGVFSMARYGDTSQGNQEFKQVLRRTMAICSHETAHIFGLHHCIKYQCNTNGSNSLEEADSRPLYTCPECAVKICWNTAVNLEDRFAELFIFYSEYGFKSAALMMEKSINILRIKNTLAKIFKSMNVNFP